MFASVNGRIKSIKRFLRELLFPMPYPHNFSDIGLHGESWGAAWDRSYWEIVNKKFRLIHQLSQNRRNPQMRWAMNQVIDDYENIVRRNYNDQTVWEWPENKRLDAEQVIKAGNTVTNDGMTQIALQVCNEINEFFEFYAYGVGTTTPELTDLILEQEVGRVSIASGAGYHGGSGTSIKHAGIFAQGFPSADITENAAFTQPERNTGVMLFRTVFPTNEPLRHEINSTFFTLAHIIYMSSI